MFVDWFATSFQKNLIPLTFDTTRSQSFSLLHLFYSPSTLPLTRGSGFVGSKRIPPSTLQLTDDLISPMSTEAPLFSGTPDEVTGDHPTITSPRTHIEKHLEAASRLPATAEVNFRQSTSHAAESPLGSLCLSGVALSYVPLPICCVTFPIPDCGLESTCLLGLCCLRCYLHCF